MNLLVLDQFSDLGGAQQNLLELLPAIAYAGWRTLIGLPGSGELFDRIRAFGFEVERIACGPYRSGGKSLSDSVRFLAGTPQLAAQIRRMARRINADVIYVNGPRLLPAVAIAGLGLPVLFHSHSYLPPGPVRTMAGFALQWTNARVVGQCEFVSAPWRLFVRADRVSVIFNGIAAPRATAERPAAAPPLVGCIGRIAPEKGQREFIAAAAQIHHTFPECRFVIYGAPLFGDKAADRYAADVRSDAAGLPLEFAGWVPDMPSHIGQLDLLLVPSAGHEATTRVILEAFAAGVPVIAFPSGGIPEVVEHGVTGLLAENAHEMARLAIQLLTGDARRLISLSHAAREKWSRYFTLERYQMQIMDAMRSSVGPIALSANNLFD